MNIADIAQWVIDNRYPKSEFEKISDHELYDGIIEKIELIMNKDLSACNGVIKGGAKNCPQKMDCKRY